MRPKAVGSPPFEHSAPSSPVVRLQDILVHDKLMHSFYNRQIGLLKILLGNSFRAQIELSRPPPPPPYPPAPSCPNPGPRAPKTSALLSPVIRLTGYI